MTTRDTFARPAAVLFLCAVSLAGLRAQDTWTWPERPANLQVLPKDWPGSRLSPVMRGFTRALGVRCTHCHVGEEGKPLTTYDFASDANPNKNRAREMLRMLGDINTHLKQIEPSGEQRVNMWCHTCHRGRPRPMTLEEELGEVFRKQGAGAALDRYRALKEQFYGRGGYDFGQNGLDALGQEALRAKDVPGAIAVFRLNMEMFPQFPNGWTSLGDAYLAAGDLAQAEGAYKRSIELEPGSASARQKLEEIRKKRER